MSRPEFVLTLDGDSVPYHAGEDARHEGGLWSCPCEWCQLERQEEIATEQRLHARDLRQGVAG